MTNRRTFLKLAAATGIAGSLHLPTDLFSQNKSYQKKGTPTKLACWCHLIDYGRTDFAGSDEEAGRQMDNVVKAGFDTLFPFIYYNFKAYYKSGLTDTEDRFTRTLALAKERGIQVHPIVIAIHEFGLSKEEQIRRGYQSGPGGRQYDPPSLCASWKINREGGLKILKDILANHKVDGIHLDYIRYGDTGQSLSYPCQCEACKIEYERLFKKDILTAEDLKVPGILYKFLNFRGENIRNLLGQVKGIVQEAGLPISMAARANYFNTALVEGQDWVQWSREGIMDFICPMNYNSDRNSHKEIITTQMELLGNSVPVVDGIARKWSGGENTTSQMIRQAEDSLKSGASGVSIFSLNNLDSNDFRELGAFRRANFI